MVKPEMIYLPNPLPRAEGSTEAKTTPDISPVSQSPVKRFAAIPGSPATPPSDLRRRILGHINLFFAATASGPLVRIKRSQKRQTRCLSYPGSQLLCRPTNAPTLNLEGFTMDALNYFVIADR